MLFIFLFYFFIIIIYLFTHAINTNVVIIIITVTLVIYKIIVFIIALCFNRTDDFSGVFVLEFWTWVDNVLFYFIFQMTMWLLLILTLLLCGQVRQVTARRTVLEHIHRLVSLHDVSTDFYGFSLWVSFFVILYSTHSFIRSFSH